MSNNTIDLVELIVFIAGGSYSKCEVELIDGRIKKPFIKVSKSGHKRPIYDARFFNQPSQRYRAIVDPLLNRIKTSVQGSQIDNPMFQVRYE